MHRYKLRWTESFERIVMAENDESASACVNTDKEISVEKMED